MTLDDPYLNPLAPTVGRIVHFWDGVSGPTAAIITEVLKGGKVSLSTFPPCSVTFTVWTDIPYSAKRDPKNLTWAWPERIT